MRIRLSLLAGGLVAVVLGGAEARQVEPEAPAMRAPAPVTSMRFERRPALEPALPRAVVSPGERIAAREAGIALVMGDLDSDGALEVISGWRTDRGGYLVIHRGGPDGRPAGRGAMVESAETPDFLALGDFDRDGRVDLLTAARGGHRLQFMGGDGEGGVAEAVPLPVDGAITALVTGELDRADGLTDLAVAVSGRGGPRFLLFGSPRGLFASEPEVVAIPREASDLAIGQLDDEFPFDLAAAAGRDVLILHGRDGSVDEGRSRAQDRLEAIQVRSPIVALALGDFLLDDQARDDLALLTDDGDLLRLPGSPAGRSGRSRDLERTANDAVQGIEGFAPRHLAAARVSTRRGDDLILWTDEDRRVRVIPAAPGDAAEAPEEALLEMDRAPAQILAARPEGGALDDLAVLERGGEAPFVLESAATAIFTVNSTADGSDITPGNGTCAVSPGGPCTLRAAIQEANALPGFDTIQFTGPAGVLTIAPGSAFPTITETVAINGNSGVVTRVQLNGLGAGPVFGGLRLGFSGTTSSGGSQLRDLVINGFAGFGVVIESDGSLLERCFIGTDSAGGPTATGNAGGGILITGAPAKANSIGGAAASARCIISNNSGPGITIQSGAGTNKVAGSYIGITAAGAIASNAAQGVKIQGGAQNNVIGQPAAIPGSAPGNVISANGAAGVEITGANTNGNLVQGNLIGPGIGGVAALPNATDGVSILLGARSNTIGGALVSQGNVLSGHSFAGGDGVQISNPGTTGNFVQGNLIGTDISGAAPMANVQDGVHIDDGAAGNTIGGLTATPGAPPGNVISGNTLNGVRIMSAGSTGNVVLGNVIGIDRNSGTHVRNGSTGVTIDGAPSNLVGGMTAMDRNVISGNLGEGVKIVNDGASNNRVWGNFIGTDISGTAGLGNLGNGVLILAPGAPPDPPTATGNALGGNTPVPGTPPGNVISGNALNGVKLDGERADANSVSGNLIGTNAAGTAAIANGASGMGMNDNGILIDTWPDGNLIGGATVTARNVISGNNTAATSDGIDIRHNDANNNLIKGNYIGTDITGMIALPNGGNGVFIDDGPSGIYIGDVTSAPGVPPGNVISGNNINFGSCGVLMIGPGTGDDYVLGNIIGLNATGTAPLPNFSDGVVIRDGAAFNHVGSSTPGAGNVISANGLAVGRAGVRIFDSSSNEVKGNLIGLLASGLAPAGNFSFGVLVGSSVTPGADDNQIGGTLPAERNVISGNVADGVVITNPLTNDNLVRGNFIGTDVTGLGPMGNGSHGVVVQNGADGNVVGGLTGLTAGACDGACNVIAHNVGAGVYVSSGLCATGAPGCSLNNEIRGNRMRSNGGLGIDLAPIGVALNDALDGDIGSNHLQNYPVILSATFNGATTTVTGMLSSSLSTAFVVDVYGSPTADPSGWGEGETWLGSTTCVTTAASGTCLWTATGPSDTSYVTATATIATAAAADSTSEFSSFYTNPGAVPLMTFAPGAGGSLLVTYTPACGAIDHVIYMTSGPLGPATVWSDYFCVSGGSGTATITPPPLAGQIQYFVMAGQNSSVEGPYTATVPEAVFPGAICDRPREMTVNCD